MTALQQPPLHFFVNPITDLNVKAVNGILNFTRDGESDAFKITNKNWVNLFYWGTFAGATVALKISPNSLEWFDDANYAKTGKAYVSTEVLADVWGKWVVTGAGVGTKVSAALI